MELLDRGSAAAAAQVLERACAAEPGSRSVREALARAQFDAGRYAAAAENFRVIVEASPTDDYANFGLGLALTRTGNHAAAAEYLALAAAMRPDARHYTDALRQVRATLRARENGGRPPQEGAVPEDAASADEASTYGASADEASAYGASTDGASTHGASTEESQ